MRITIYVESKNCELGLQEIIDEKIINKEIFIKLMEQYAGKLYDEKKKMENDDN